MSTSLVTDRISLGTLEKLADGGQGTIYKTSAHITDIGPAVYKEYLPHRLDTISEIQLQRFVEFFQSFSRAEARTLLSTAAWPVQTVRALGRTTGFLMPMIPGRFLVSIRQRSGVLQEARAEFQLLLNKDHWLRERGLMLSASSHYRLLLEVVNKLQYLHHLQIVVGDFSPTNLLFSLGNQPSCYFVDCDAMSLNGGSVLPQEETPGWDLPKATKEPRATIASDTYKFGLLALRLLTGEQYLRNPVSLDSSVPRNVRKLVGQSLMNQPASRPQLAEWGEVLSSAIVTSSHIPSGKAPDSGGPAPQRPPARPPRPTPPRPVPARPIPPQQQPPPQTHTGNGKVWAWLAAICIALIVLIAIVTHHGGSAPTTTVGQPGTPSASAQSTASSGQSNGWSSGQQVDSSNNSFTAMSCPTTSFCMGVDGGGNAYSYSNGSWSGGQQVDNSSNGFVSVSCPTSSFCAATDSGADAYIYNGDSWSSSSLVGGTGGAANLTSVSCPAAGYCIATGDWNVYTYSNGAWATGQVVQEQNWFTSISCPTSSFCMAVDNGGNVYSDSNGTWSSPQQLNGSGLISISCATISFCAAIDSYNDAYIDVNGTWSNASLNSTDGDGNLTWVSCPTSGYCLATGDNDVYTYSNSTWATGYEVQDNNNFASVSCPTTSFCMAVDGGGEAYSYSGG
jgi:eukaryotic-like serine/threonine-protein kinase